MIARPAFFLFLGLLLLGCVAGPPSHPPPQEKWSSMELKLTYIATQEKPVPTIGISVKEFTVDRFSGHGISGIDYGNDDLPFRTIRISENEMKTVVYRVSALDFVQHPVVPREPALSLMLYNATSNRVSEVVLDDAQAAILARTIRGSLVESLPKAGILSAYP